MERKLASIQRISAITPIEGADKIEVATILGWQVVIAKKDNFKVGDWVVYIEIDSILPDKPEFEFMRERKFRVKTIKLRGQVSQGICFPLSILGKGNFKEDDDVTELLGIRKYDPQADFERKETERLASIDRNRMDKFLKRYSWYRKLMFRPNRKPFPAFIKKTDEDRIQLFPDYYEKWKHLTFDVTEKLDGQSATYFMIKNPEHGLFRKKWLFGVCSRNFQLLKKDNSSYWTLAEKLKIQDKMKWWCNSNNKGLIIQGEALGPRIQGNKYGLIEYSLYVFNIASYDKGQTVNFNQGEQFEICESLSLFPVTWLYSQFELYPTIREMVEFAKGNSRLNENILREGVVIRNYENNVSFKVINSDFLLKYQE